MTRRVGQNKLLSNARETSSLARAFSAKENDISNKLPLSNSYNASKPSAVAVVSHVSYSSNAHRNMAGLLELVSYAFGWIYTFCWSASFYPQPILNWRRGTTKGTTIEFPVINAFGFLAYFIFNSAFLYSPVIRKQYAARNHGLTPTVRFNDLAFAGHAVVMSLVVLTQFWKRIWGLKKGPGKERQISTPIIAVIAGSFIAPLIVLLLVQSSDNPDPQTGWAYIDVVRIAEKRPKT